MQWAHCEADGKRIVCSTSSKMLYFLEAREKEVAMQAYFPSAGPFGSADGVGGQGAVMVRNGKSVVVAGDQTGRIYVLTR